MAGHLHYSAADFWDLLQVTGDPFTLSHPVESTNLAGGEVLRAELAAPHWQGQVRLPAMRAREAEAVLARLRMLGRPGASFEIGRNVLRGPGADRLGAALDGFAPVLEDVVDAHSLRLGGLPAGYQLQRGDFLAFDYDGGRRAFHQLADAGLADQASGFAASATGPLAVAPYIRPGWAAGASVSLVRPACVAVLVPGQTREGEPSGRNHAGIAFGFRQSLRRVI